ncbi:MAG: YciI family protein [Candidatus Paracaedibacteraceae bacterium]|nr:YciI family protein [Candidatus Paracaedibacteraceae bacterium]
MVSIFIIILKYTVPVQRIEQSIISHREYLKSYYESGQFLISGPLVPRTGGVILAKANDRQEIDKIMQKDPFTLEKIAEYEIIEFNVANSADVLKDFFK